MKFSGKDKKSRAKRIIRSLQKLYPSARCSLDFKNPLELLIAARLSAQCRDERVNRVTKTLFKKYKTAKDFAKAPLPELERDIKSTGFFRAKARQLKEMARQMEERHKGSPPKDFKSLTRLSGIGRKTAHVVMGNGFHIPSGIVVDTHVRRLANRMGLVKTGNVLHIEKQLQRIIPKKYWIVFSHYLIFHGRSVCKARKPACSKCLLAELCPKAPYPAG